MNFVKIKMRSVLNDLQLHGLSGRSVRIEAAVCFGKIHSLGMVYICHLLCHTAGIACAPASVNVSKVKITLTCEMSCCLT